MAAGSREPDEMNSAAVESPASAAPTRTPERDAAVRDHLANERTLLAWQRTAFAAIGLGFVVDRFALGGSTGALLGSIVGLGLICLGGAAAALGVHRYVRTSQQIDTNSYRPVLAVHILVAGGIVVAAAVLVALLVLAPDRV
jgi:putative membrane protein